MGTQNAINNSTISFYKGLGISGLKFPVGFIGNAGSGDIDIYTVPSGKRAFINEIDLFNTAGSTTTLYFEVKISGVYYRLSPTTTLATNTYINIIDLNQGTPIILEEGDTIALNMSQAGINLWTHVMEFDKTSGMKSPRLLSLASGDNILYTVPAMKSVFIMGSSTWNGDSNSIFGFNNSGSTITMNLNYVPNGGVSGLGNKVISQVNVGGANPMQLSGGTSLNASDSIILNASNNANPFVVWCNIMEV
jgi:hypothetical protein